VSGNKIKNKLNTSKILDRENALLMRQSPKWMQTFAVLMLLLASGLLVAAYSLKIDEVVTAVGQLKSSKGRNDVKTPAGGKVSRVYVTNGEQVKTGDPLIKFDTTLAAEKKAESEELIALEVAGLQRKLEVISLQKESLQQRLTTKTTLVEEYQKLAKFGGIARINLLEAKDQIYELQSQINSLKQRQKELEIDSQKTIRKLQTDLKSANQQLFYQQVNATSSGIVFDIKARESGVLTEGSTILSIIPTDGLKAEVFIPNKDIGFVKIGQDAKIRVDAFPSNRYGELDGVVKLIGADALPPNKSASFFHFPIDIELKDDWLENKGLKIPLRSGMAITSNLIIRNKRVISIIGDFFTGQLNSIKALRN